MFMILPFYEFLCFVNLLVLCASPLIYLVSLSLASPSLQTISGDPESVSIESVSDPLLPSSISFSSSTLYSEQCTCIESIHPVQVTCSDLIHPVQFTCIDLTHPVHVSINVRIRYIIIFIKQPLVQNCKDFSS